MINKINTIKYFASAIFADKRKLGFAVKALVKTGKNLFPVLGSALILVFAKTFTNYLRHAVLIN